MWNKQTNKQTIKPLVDGEENLDDLGFGKDCLDKTLKGTIYF